MDVYNDEKTLIKAISCGNKDAFEYIFKRYYQRLTGFGRRYIQDTEVVQDIVQDCFAVLWEKHSSVSVLSLTGTVIRINNNRLADLLGRFQSFCDLLGILLNKVSRYIYYFLGITVCLHNFQ